MVRPSNIQLALYGLAALISIAAFTSANNNEDAAIRWRKTATDEFYYRLVAGSLETLDFRKGSPEARELCTKSTLKNAKQVLHGRVVVKCHNEEHTRFTIEGYRDGISVVKVTVPNPANEGHDGVIPSPITDPFNSRHALWEVTGPLLPE